MLLRLGTGVRWSSTFKLLTIKWRYYLGPASTTIHVFITILYIELISNSFPYLYLLVIVGLGFCFWVFWVFFVAMFSHFCSHIEYPVHPRRIIPGVELWECICFCFICGCTMLFSSPLPFPFFFLFFFFCWRVLWFFYYSYHKGLWLFFSSSTKMLHTRDWGIKLNLLVAAYVWRCSELSFLIICHMYSYLPTAQIKLGSQSQKKVRDIVVLIREWLCFMRSMDDKLP